MTNNNFFSAVAAEEIHNNSICIYDPRLETVSNIKGIDDFKGRFGCSFVFVNQIFPADHCGEEIIKYGEYIRCAFIYVTFK